MHKTKNDIPEATRSKIAELLNVRLAECLDLYLTTKQAHWNVKGPNFIALHELFDNVAEEVEGHVDTIAERITALGGYAEGTTQVIKSRSTLKEYPLNIVNGRDHVEHLSTALA